MNIQHSSRTDQWYTPVSILDRVKKVLGSIDLDPASSEEANLRVGAKKIITADMDGLNTNWTGKTVFVNPPGGKLSNRSRTALFWERLMEYRAGGSLEQAIFLAFSLEALQSTQGKGVPAIGEFTLCVPSKRIKFDSAEGIVGAAPSHSNVIVYVPGTVNNVNIFADCFRSLGSIIHEP